MNNSNLRKGFSLVELLVTIAIIAILALILIPTIGSVLETSRTTACTSNLHGIGLAIQLYYQEHGEPSPIHQGRDENGNPLGATAAYYARLINEGYIDKGTDVFYSPNNEYPDQCAWQTNEDLNVKGISYGWNVNIHDGHNSLVSTYSPHAEIAQRYPILITMNTSPEVNPGGASVAFSLRERVGYLHHGKANVLYPDGRVELKDPDYFEENSNWRPTTVPPPWF